MPSGGRRHGAGRKPGSRNKLVALVEKVAPAPPKTRPPVTFAVVDGGDGSLPEPDWSSLFADELDLAIAREQWAIILRELRDSEKLATANAHQVKRLVVSYVLYEVATRRVAEEGAVFPRQGKRQPSWNPWWTVLKDANAMASVAEAELTITPRRRAHGGKVEKRQKRTSAADAYLRPVAR